MSKVIVHLKDGKSFETTEHNLPNNQRLLGDKITGIERPGQKTDLTDEIDSSLVVEEINNNPKTEEKEKVEEKVEEKAEEKVEEKVEDRLPTLEELMGTDKDVLKRMALNIAEKKAITKPNGRAGVKGLAEYVFENQNK